MNKVVSYLGYCVYAELMPADPIFKHKDQVKLYLDTGGAQSNLIFLNREQIEALKKFLRDIEEEECK